MWLAIASWVLRRNVLFLAVGISIASLFKGFLALLLLCPLCACCDRQTFRALLPGLLITIGPHVIAAVFDAASYRQFTVIATELMNDEFNYTPRGILKAYALDGWPFEISYLFVAFAVLGCTLWNVRRRWRLDGDTAQLRLWTMVSACLALGLTMPRLKDYSLLLMLPPILTVVQSRIHPLIAAALAFAVCTVSVEAIFTPVAVIAAAWLLAMVQLFKGEYDTPARNPWPGSHA